MIPTVPYSDQLFNWSANVRRSRYKRLAAAPQEAAHAASAIGFPIAGLAHRALQALRKPQLPLPERPWPRTQILSFCQPPKVSAEDGLRARGLSGASPRTSRTLRLCPRDSQRDQRHQQRAASSARGVLTNTTHGPTSNRERASGLRRHQSHRCHRGENVGRHAAKLPTAIQRQPGGKTS